MKTGLVIAIDGPAGAGKSSVSQHLAQRLGYRYIDTGALYRVIGLVVWEQSVNPDDAAQLDALCENLQLHVQPGPTGMRLAIGERDVTAAIRRPEVSQMASRVSAQPVVRRRLFAIQRDLGKAGNVIVEGRDIGTTIFPDADIKFYLDASPEERGRRRYIELQQQGAQTTFATTLREMQERDQRDSVREHAPLCRAADAIIVDTTALSLEEVVDTLVRFVHDHASVDGSKEKQQL